jgi:inorganic pyrophosphatase
MNIRVFIQNEAGSNKKHYHDETTLEWKRTAEVSLPYPYPYGFIVGTVAEDGCNVDCFVITDRTLKTGQLIECDAVGLMEQFEDGQDDHNVLACPLGEVVEVGGDVQARLTGFVLGVFAHVESKRMSVGRFLEAEAARAHVLTHAKG